MPRAIAVAGVAPEGGSYRHAVAAEGELLFVAGQAGVDADGVLAGADAASQARQALRNVEAILRSAGAGLDALVKLTVFVTDPAHAAAVGQARAELLDEPYPASSAVVVAGLLDPEWLVEIEAVAEVPRR